MIAHMKSHLHANNDENKKAIETSDEIVTEGRSLFLPKYLVGNQLPTSPTGTITKLSITITTVARCIKSH